MDYTLIMLLAYAAVMFGSTVIMTKKEGSVEKFCVGERDAGWGMSALSIAATWIWAPALFTSAESAYVKGFAGLFWFLAPNALCLILFIPFAKKIREEIPEAITLSGYMYGKYGSKPVRNAYLFQLGTLSALSTGVQLLAGSRILSMLTGIPFAAMTVIMAVIAFSYSQFSGIKASMLTDAIQMAFMLAAGIAVANIPGLTVTHLFLVYGTLRASTLLPTVLTFAGVKLEPKAIVVGIISAMVIGLPVFGYGNMQGIAVYKTVGSLLTVSVSGAAALALSAICR